MGGGVCCVAPSENSKLKLFGVKATLINDHTFDAYLCLTLLMVIVGFLFPSTMIPDKNVSEQDSLRGGTPLPFRQGRPHEE